ncbi:ABC transporter ATP-binding protein [Nocardioides marmoraquaticus]
MTTSAAIRTQCLTKSYGDTAVLRGVDLTVSRGTVHALLGSNGAGKTTLVRILATLLAPDGGSAEVGGHDVVTAPHAVRSSISLTGQTAAVDGVLTGRENLALVARLRQVDDPAGVADDLLERFDLADAGRRRAATYSGGMRRRLDLAMGLVGDPAIILLDEPTTGLDPQSRREVWRTVTGLAESGTTVLLTTQYLEEAEQVADRISILHEGRVITEGTLDDLRSLLPSARVEHVEKRPSLEDVFLAVVGRGVTS